MGDGPGQVRAGQGVGHKDEGQRRHDIAQHTAGALQRHKAQGGAGEDGHPGGLAQTLGHMVDLVLGHPPANPAQDDECNINHPANGAEGLVAGEFVLKHMLVERLGQQNQRHSKSQMDAALGDEILQAENAGPDVEECHTERHNGGNLDKFILFPFLYRLSRSQFAVQRGYVYFLVFFFCHSIESFLPKMHTVWYFA